MTVRPGDATGRLGVLAEYGELLWNRPATVSTRGPKNRGAMPELVVVPSRARPRLAVPADQPRSAAGAVLAHGRMDSTSARVGRLLLAGLFRCGAGARLFRTGLQLDTTGGPGVLEYLSELLGERVVASIPLTPPRANRKPVLHLLDTRGNTVAFVKVGINGLTRELVRREAATLRQLGNADLGIVAPPSVLHAGSWNDLELLVLAPLPTRRATEPEPTLLASAMRELADVEIRGDAGRRHESYVDTLLDRADAALPGLDADDREALTGLRADLELLGADLGTSHVRLGTWHGDWTPWNCGQRGGRVLVWDWERCRSSVPHGFDALHYAMQRAIVRGRESHRQAALRCIDNAPELLRPWGITRRVAQLVAALYLGEIGVRYLVDGQRTAGGLGGEVHTWVLPVVHRAARAAGTVDR